MSRSASAALYRGGDGIVRDSNPHFSKVAQFRLMQSTLLRLPTLRRTISAGSQNGHNKSAILTD